MQPLRAKLSAFVISYNRASIIRTCLTGLGFADEILLVDKSSTDDTPRLAEGLVDRVITVPWSPTVEETRAFALEQCAHDWILFLDDDECLSSEAVVFIDAELRAPRADIYELPLRDHILGVHDERAFYWPARQIRLFKRGALDFRATVHSGIVPRSARVHAVPAESGVAVHNISHADVAQWIEKTNRYTARPDRVRRDDGGRDLVRFAKARIDHWQAAGDAADPGGYPAAVALLCAVYDMVDRLKSWEEERGLDGHTAFAGLCAALEADYAARLGALARPRATARSAMTPLVVAYATVPADARIEAVRTAAEQARNRLEAELAGATARAAAIEASTLWRAGAGLRRAAARHPGLARFMRRATQRM